MHKQKDETKASFMGVFMPSSQEIDRAYTAQLPTASYLSHCV